MLFISQFQIQLGEHEHELIEMNSNSDRLRQSYNELLEFKMVLQKVIFLFLFSLCIDGVFSASYLLFCF